jgi:hypothetical protein
MALILFFQPLPLLAAVEVQLLRELMLATMAALAVAVEAQAIPRLELAIPHQHHHLKATMVEPVLQLVEIGVAEVEALVLLEAHKTTLQILAMAAMAVHPH